MELSMTAQPEQVLKEYFGFESFRPGQKKVVESLLAGRDVLAIMPTGAGKSICFQVPALMFPRGTVVISPLISLMKDQVETLRSQGIPASYVNSTIPYEESIERLRDLYRGTVKILYMAPEKLESSYFMHCLLQVPLSMVVIDEAHCVSQWGHDFRPSYRGIRHFVESLPQRPLVSAFTATATPVVEKDVRQLLGLGEAQVFRTGLDRPNLSFRVLRGLSQKEKDRLLVKYVKSHREESGIIYCATRKAVDSVYELLLSHGISAGRYHAGLTDEERRNAQDDFSFDRISVMAATNAFGMGIDKSNVRYVIHYQMPGSLESYYQEAGRAGRDGAKAECILLYSPRDASIQKFLLEQGNLPEEQLQLEYKRLGRMTDYCGTTTCLRNFILSYFGEQVDAPCGHCSSCDAMEARVDNTDTAVLIFRTIQNAGERYGVSVIADILKGSRSRAILDRHLDRELTYGKLSFEKTGNIKEAIHTLVADGYLGQENEPYPILVLTDRAREVMAGRKRVMGPALGLERAAAEQIVERSARTFQRGSLFDQLAALRSQLAAEEHVPPFVVFSDATLEEMANLQPQTLDDMSRIPGVGAFKLQKYGARFLELLTHREEKDQVPAKEKETPKKPSASDSVPETLSGEDEFVYQILSAARMKRAKEEGKKPFHIFSNRTLRHMAVLRPRTKEEMMEVFGIGEGKWNRYGPLFLDVVQDALNQLNALPPDQSGSSK